MIFLFLLGLFAAEVKLFSEYQHGQHQVLPLMTAICAVIAVVVVWDVARGHGSK